MAGSFECKCRDGFEGGFRKCESECTIISYCDFPNETAAMKSDIYDTCVSFSDINECLMDVCDENAVCTDTKGGYTCKCVEGFVGNGETCDQGVYCCLVIPTVILRKYTYALKMAALVC